MGNDNGVTEGDFFWGGLLSVNGHFVAAGRCQLLGEPAGE